MNQVCGKVFLKETNVGIPDLLVEIYDVDPGTRPEEIFRAHVPTKSDPTLASAATLGRAKRVVSGVTRDNGSFEFEYEDSDLRRNLLLIVRAPEEMDSESTRNILHFSKDIRQEASSKEVYMIRIPTEKLLAAGLSAPTGVPLDVEEPDAILQKVNLAVSRQVKIKREIQKIAAKQVAAERQRTARIDKAVENRLLEKLTGVPDNLAERLNYVPPGANVEAAMFRTLNKSIEEKINKNRPAKGYIVLSEEQAKKFKKRDGTFRDNIPAAEIKPFLFGSADDDQRPTFLTRENPTDVTRPSQPPLAFLERDIKRDGSNKKANSSKQPNKELSILAVDAPTPSGNKSLTVAPEPIADFVNRLIGTMTSPEEGLTYGVEARPTQERIETSVKDLKLHSGPADVPAFYDFHSLQIAFDYVWQKAIDEGVIESTKILSQQLQDMGGDPVAAMSNGTDPIKALRNELRTIQTAHANSTLTPIMNTTSGASAYRMQPDGNSSSNGRKVSEDFVPPLGLGDILTVDTAITKEQADAARRWTSPEELLDQIESLLNQRFAFEIFAPGSVNFGILVTYRQRWIPQAYQVGNLVKTLTLTPKETRKVSAKRVVKKDRSVKEMENSLRIRKEESSNTGRDEAEIIAKAEAKTNFNLTAKGTFDIYIAEGDSTTVFGKDATTNSSDTKKAFRESVIKAAQEYKDERKLELETKETYEEEVTESVEITNPNDELPVTYLFYELQRRYKISEQIYRLSPIVLVAMDVPNPSRQAIDALLLSYGWIIDRVLLDDQFRRPLEYFRTKLAGEAFALREMERNLVIIQRVVEELKKNYAQLTKKLEDAVLRVDRAMKERADKIAEEETEGFGEKAWEFVVGSGDDEDLEAARLREDAAKEAYERAVREEHELRSRLNSETDVLRAASDDFAKAYAEHLNCLVDIGTLRLHIKENILYYMQAIWSHTFKDQIFLALHKKKVPLLTPHEQSYSLSQPTEAPPSVPLKAGEIAVEVEAKVQFESGLDPDKDFVTLAEVADLDNLLGFKGNYLIFPLRQSNALTDFMMTPFVDSELGLRDPDEFGNFTPEEFLAYAHALHEEMKRQLEKGEITEKELEAAIDRLGNQLRRLLSAPRRAEDEIVVPTGSLYIEALPGAHPILEDFKLLHRAIDVKKVQAEVRKLEMENIRYAARIIEGDREDPDIERKVVISGNGQAIVVPPIEN